MEIRLALTGFGNVGQGVAQLILERGEEYEARYGVRLLLTGVADRGGAATDTSGLDLRSVLRAKKDHGSVSQHGRGEAGLKGEAFLDASRAAILIEAASTNFDDAEPGWSYVLSALSLDMDVVLASKGALVLHFVELMAKARAAGKKVMFAGTVGAPVPVLELASEVLVGSTINAVEGILNGTTNQILTSMEEGASYEDGVRRAQEMGIAETDPTLDVDGWDAAAKAVILANAVLGADLKLSDVARQGIRGVTADDLNDARAQGKSIRLIARVERAGSSVRATVGPVLRDANETLGRLRNDQMGIVFHTDILGKVSTTTEAGGGVPTALTVLRDVFNLASRRGWREQ